MGNRGYKFAPVASEKPGPQVMCCHPLPTHTAGLGCYSPGMCPGYPDRLLCGGPELSPLWLSKRGHGESQRPPSSEHHLSPC